MFSGIRYIFGYADETPASSDKADTTSSSGQQNESLSSITSSSSATVLEQTLNAATTKFTEQLLPQQASIERLQSSSHQLLPSIKEQRENNEPKSQLTNFERGVEAIKLNEIEEEDFVADSWELLDLVDKEEEERPVVTAQRGETSSLVRSSSGILKTAAATIGTNSKTSPTGCQPSRQKPKVSFETPDLVRSKQEIEQSEPKDASPSASSKRSKGKKNKRNLVASSSSSGNGTKALAKLPKSATVDEIAKTRESKVNEVNPSQNAGPMINDDSRQFESVVPKTIQAPTLNYAKALSAKPKGQGGESAKNVSIAAQEIIESKQDVGSTVKTESNGTEDGAVKADTKPTKRQRPTYASSWSSSSETEIENELDSSNGMANVETSPTIVDADVDEDDKISLTSSGFSDCDYGFGGISDYVMRPKKATAKRNRTQSGSSGSFRAPKVGRSSSTKHAGANNRQPISAVSTSTSDEAKLNNADVTRNATATASTKNSKLKKKKLNSSKSSSRSAKSVDFLKPQAIEKKTKNGEFFEPSQLNQSPASSSNDSSEIPEMDESWYVTPPPCFTGANKLDTASKSNELQPKAKEAARENALIEHPTIYIASSSKQVKVIKQNAVSDKEATKKGALVELKAPQDAPISKLEDAAWQSEDDINDFDDDQFVCSKPVPTLATMAKQQAQTLNTAKHSDETKVKAKSVIKQTTLSTNTTKRVPSTVVEKSQVRVVSVKPIEKKAWKNKFIVDDWDLDEQEDVDSDFDSMFEPVKKKKSKARRQEQRSKKVQVAASNEMPVDINTDSDDMALDSIVEDNRPNAVELISINSLSMEDSLNAEKEFNLFGNVQQPVDRASKEEKPSKRRQATIARPIEPERRPGWQLKKQRAKRRPLVSSSIENKQQSTNGKSSKNRTSMNDKGAQSAMAASSSSSPSRRSSPTFMDRIGSSIVANLTNLTNGLVSSGALNACPPVGHSSPLVENSEKGHQTVATKAANMHSGTNPNSRKQLSRGSLKRQNITSQQANMQRRPDRRLKMFANPNGSSVNRKVHASIH